MASVYIDKLLKQNLVKFLLLFPDRDQFGSVDRLLYIHFVMLKQVREIDTW